MASVDAKLLVLAEKYAKLQAQVVANIAAIRQEHATIVAKEGPQGLQGLAGVRYGPGGIYVGTATGGGGGTRVEISTGRVVKLIGSTGAYLT